MTATDPLILPFPGAADTASHHLLRAELTPRRPRALHGHGFFELLWVQNGTLRHHLPGGWTDLPEGTMLFIRPGDLHGLQGKGEATIVVSLSIRANVIEALGKAHSQLMGRLFWADGERPAMARRDIRELAELNHAALRLDRAPRTELALLSFLLPLLSDLTDAGSDVPPQAPAWLHEACEAARKPEVFREGAAGLAHVAGRAHPHVARTLRRWLDMTPSDYINRLRMDHAARQLIGSDDTLAEIAEDCGIPNLSHFHKLFLAHHGQTPQRFRRANRTQLLQP